MLDNNYFNNQEDEVVLCHCPACDGEIYVGDDIYIVDGEYVHEDCLLLHLENTTDIRRSVAGDV